MATRSAAKAHRQSLKRQLRNRAVKGATKTAVKKAVSAVTGGDLEAAPEAVRQALSALDKAAKKGVLHWGNVARHKSRLQKRLNAALTPPQALPEPSPERKAPARRRTRAAPRGRASK